METIYYSIDAKRLTGYARAEGQRVCGGQETVCYAFVPSRGRKPAETGAGKVVDFTAYQKAHAVPAAEEPAAGEPVEENRPARQAREKVRWKLLDLCASGAVMAASLVILVRFLAL